MRLLSELLPRNGRGGEGVGALPSDADACRTCGGTGYVADEEEWEASHYRRCPVLPCPACGQEHRRAALTRVDGMDPEQHAMTFENYDLEAGDRNAWNAVRWAVRRRHGMVTLYGGYGRGKTHLLSAAVNACVADGVLAAYVTLPELLRRLREAVQTDRDVLGRYTDLPVLAVDEMGRGALTEWGQEQLFLLVDRRYLAAQRRLTLYAWNDAPAEWPGYVRSRLSERGFSVIRMRGGDVRPSLERGRGGDE